MIGLVLVAAIIELLAVAHDKWLLHSVCPRINLGVH